MTGRSVCGPQVFRVLKRLIRTDGLDGSDGFGFKAKRIQIRAYGRIRYVTEMNYTIIYLVKPILGYRRDYYSSCFLEVLLCSYAADVTGYYVVERRGRRWLSLSQGGGVVGMIEVCTCTYIENHRDTSSVPLSKRLNIIPASRPRPNYRSFPTSSHNLRKPDLQNT